jgi:hypothetical protein
MKKIKFLLLGTLMLLINSCSVSDQASKKIKWSLQGGINIGGITDNTDMTLIPNVNPLEEGIDAYSGATKLGVNTGIHINKPFRYGEIESGLDYMFNKQTFIYADEGNSYFGKRDLSVSQLLIPITYNMNLFRKTWPNAEFQFKIGYVGQINFVNFKGTGVLPDYTINRWSNGGTVGLSVYPFQLENGSKLGIYLDVYRGSQIYEDHYNQPAFEMPGSSYMKAGLRYRLP